MPWARFDDRYDDNPKVKRAWRRAPAAVGLHGMAITYASRHETDGAIDAEWVEEKIPNARQRKLALDVLVDCELFEQTADGYLIHDFLVYNPSRTEHDERRGWDRKRKSLFRDRPLVAAIRERDGDHCRYCGEEVNWADRKSPRGGTYDHVQPRGDNTLENVVVACHGCNSRKGARTPADAGMKLRRVRSELDLGFDPNQARVRSPSTRARNGSGRDNKTDSPQGGEGLTREIVDGAITILITQFPDATADALVGPMGAHPNADLLQGCHLAVSWAAGPDWQMKGCAATLATALGHLERKAPKLDEKARLANKDEKALEVITL